MAKTTKTLVVAALLLTGCREPKTMTLVVNRQAAVRSTVDGQWLPTNDGKQSWHGELVKGDDGKLVWVKSPPYAAHRGLDAVVCEMRKERGDAEMRSMSSIAIIYFHECVPDRDARSLPDAIITKD